MADLEKAVAAAADVVVAQFTAVPDSRQGPSIWINAPSDYPQMIVERLGRRDDGRDELKGFNSTGSCKSSVCHCKLDDLHVDVLPVSDGSQFVEGTVRAEAVKRKPEVSILPNTTE